MYKNLIKKGKIMFKIKKAVYIHENYKIGWFRFSFYRLGWKFCVRIELSSGWEN